MNFFRDLKAKQEINKIYKRLTLENEEFFKIAEANNIHLTKDLIYSLWNEIKNHPSYFKERNASPNLLSFFLNMASNRCNNLQKVVFYHLQCNILNTDSINSLLETTKLAFNSSNQENLIRETEDLIASFISYLKHLKEKALLLDKNPLAVSKEEIKQTIETIVDITQNLANNAEGIYHVSFYKIYRKIALYNTFIYHLNYEAESDLLDVKNVYKSIMMWNNQMAKFDLEKLVSVDFNFEKDWKEIRFLRQHKIDPIIDDLKKYQNNLSKLYNTIYSNILFDNQIHEDIFNELLNKNYISKSTVNAISIGEYLSIDLYSCENKFIIWYLQSILTGLYITLSTRKDTSLYWMSIVLSLSTTLLALATVAVAIVTGVCA